MTITELKIKEASSEAGTNLLAVKAEINSESSPETESLISRQYHGVFYGMLSAISLCCANVFVKKCQLTSGSDQAFVRYLIQAIAMSIAICHTGVCFLGPKGSRKFLVIRGTFGTIAMICLHFALKLINPSDATALLHLNTVLVTVFARVALKEKLSLAHLACLLLSALGVLFIAQPSFLFGARQVMSVNNQTVNGTLYTTNTKPNEFAQITNSSFILGISLAITAAVLSAVVAVVLKKLSNSKVHWSVTTIYASYFGIPVTSLISYVLIQNDFAPRDPQLYSTIPSLLEQVGYSVTSALCGTLSQVFVNVALRYEDASKVSIYRSTDLFFTYIFQYFLMDISTNLLSAVGAFLIIFGTVLILIYKIAEKKVTKRTAKARETNDQNLCTKIFLFKF